MKRVASIVLVGLLTACGGSSGSTEVACENDYTHSELDLQLCLPSGWSIVDAQTLQLRGVSDDTVVAFQHDEPISGQFPTVLVTTEELTTAVEAVEYARASMRSVGILPGYELLDSPNTTVDDDTLPLHIYAAQPVQSEPKRRFYQLSTVSGTTGYSVTGVTPVAVSDELDAQILLIVQSLSFTKQAEVEEGEEE